MGSREDALATTTAGLFAGTRGFLEATAVASADAVSASGLVRIFLVFNKYCCTSIGR